MIRVIKRVCLIALPLSMLAGCATLSKQECLTANWETIGYSDGAAGYGGDRLGSHNRACSRVNIAPDLQAWERGRLQGLQQYCTQSNAYQIGKVGRQLNAVCPATTTPMLRRINADGREVYNLTRQLQANTEQLSTYQKELTALREGDSLEFETEVEAREYLLSLPTKIRLSQTRIENAERRLSELRKIYGY